MGGVNSSPTRNPSNADTVPTSSPTSANRMPSSVSNSKTSKTESNSPQDQAPIDPLDSTIDGKVEDFSLAQEQDDDEEEEEEGECGFCLFMKGGGCKDSFINWENCIREAQKNKEDVVEKCVDITAALKTCMEAHADYYEPLLKAEQQAMDEVERQGATADSKTKDNLNNSGKEGASNDKLDCPWCML